MVNPNESVKAQYEELAKQEGWKTSAIDGDPLLGDKVFFYFTSHEKEYEALLDRMLDLENKLPMKYWKRSKIEHIVYDTKTGIGVDG